MGKYLSHNLEDPQNLTFMGDVDAALHRRGHPWAFTLSLAVVLFFFVAYIWADFTMIDDIIRGNGKIIPAEEIHALSKLPGREGLLSMLLSALTGNLRNLAVGLNAVAEKKAEEEGAAS